MHTNLFALIPITTSIVLMISGKKTRTAMLISAFIGICLNRLLCFQYNLPLFSLSAWFSETIMANISTIISVYLLGFLVYLISESHVLEASKAWFLAHIKSEKQFVVTIPLLCGIMSQDDYLCCLSVGYIVRTFRKLKSFPTETFAVIINTCAVLVCSLSPLSSWTPVLKGEVKNAGLPASFFIQTLPFNLTAFLFLITIIHLCKKVINKKLTFVAESRKATKEKCSNFMVLCTILSSLPLFFILLNMCSADYPLIYACILGIFVTLAFLISCKIIRGKTLFSIFKKSFIDMTSLVFTLISIWTVVLISNDFLAFNSLFLTLFTNLNVPRCIMPALLFLLASLFSFATGSCYGSFSLFISLGASISTKLAPEMLAITIAASISGSLLGAYSPSSDTSMLISESTGISLQKIRAIQLPLYAKITISGVLGYLLLGLTVRIPYGSFLSIIITILIFCTAVTEFSMVKPVYVPITIAYTNTCQSYPISAKELRLKYYAKQKQRNILFFKHMPHLRII